jgi:hypothetical protein
VKQTGPDQAFVQNRKGASAQPGPDDALNEANEGAYFSRNVLAARQHGDDGMAS